MNEAQLRDELALREASLADATRELAAGELSESDYQALVSRETAALERVRSALADLAPVSAEPTTTAPKAKRRRSPRRLVVALVCFALASIGLVWINVSLRQAGTSQTGSVQVNGAQAITQLLTEGQGDLAQGNDLAALVAYQNVLRRAPHNVIALTEAGWLEFSAGSASRNPAIVAYAIRSLRKAIQLAPKNPAPHLYYGIIAASTPSNQAIAKKQFEEFLADRPSVNQLAIAKSYLAHFKLRY